MGRTKVTVSKILTKLKAKTDIAEGCAGDSSLTAVVADLHANSSLGLCPAEGVDLDDGGHYTPSDLQKWLWDHWMTYWGVVDGARGSRPLTVVLLGDLVDGDHHGIAQSIMPRHLETQHRIAMAVLQPVLDLNPASVYVVRGTEVHVGQSGQHEEWIARDLGAVPEPVNGTYSRWDLRLSRSGVRMDFEHHGSVGKLPWTTPNLVVRTAAEVVMQYANNHETPPHLAIFGHCHTWGDSYDAVPVTRAITLGAWQGKTSYGYRLGPVKMPGLGGIFVECENGSYEVSKYKFKPERSAVEVE